MNAEALRLNLTPEARTGGIIVDEMSIQQDIQFNKNGDVIELTGLENVGEEGEACDTLRKGFKSVSIGSHALQLIFLGNTGFRFPFGHFITSNVQAFQLQSIFWDAVDYLMMYGFTVSYVCMDGAQANRSFMATNVKKGSHSMIAKNVPDITDSNQPVVFLMDPSHVFKKIRNNLLKSGITKGCTRHITLKDGKVVNWQMWIDAYNWDQANALQLHRRLSNEHMFPTMQSKMRNHLAEQVLNDEMLNLMSYYKESLGNGGDILTGAIELLSNTSKMIKIFHDRQPVKCQNDSRLTELEEINDWFQKWSSSAREGNERAPEKAKKLMSAQCMQDIESCLVGFVELCKLTLKTKEASITPALINSDVVENHFCQQRSTYNGPNSNPNALQYRNNQNAIILGQNIVSHKSNVGKSLKSPAISFAVNETPSSTGSKRKISKCLNESVKKKVKLIRV